MTQCACPLGGRWKGEIHLGQNVREHVQSPLEMLRTVHKALVDQMDPVVVLRAFSACGSQDPRLQTKPQRDKRATLVPRCADALPVRHGPRIYAGGQPNSHRYALFSADTCLLRRRKVGRRGGGDAFRLGVNLPSLWAARRSSVSPALIHGLQSGQSIVVASGEQVRDSLHVEDVASPLVTLIERQANGVFSISSGIHVTMRQLMETIGGVVGRTDLIKLWKLPSRG